MKVLVLATCYNRINKTKKFIETLVAGNPKCQFTFVIVDDNSCDGTKECLAEMAKVYNICVLHGNGNLYYSGGMRKAMDYVITRFQDCKYEYILLANDDVTFFGHCIEQIAEQSKCLNGAVIVGATKNSSGDLSYSGIRYTRGIHYEKVPIAQYNRNVDTFNANCVLIPYKVFLAVGSMDPHYVHSLGDFDYGLSIKKAGYHIYVSKDYVGLCEQNSASGTWLDKSLSRRERIVKKESPKGAPVKQWFYFLKKNFGLVTAVRYTVTPYIRIMADL